MVLRGPFDFIGNWIQGSEWFPLEVNVPDTFGAVGSAVNTAAQGVGSFAQGVGNNIGVLAQNLGQGFQTFSQNLGNGFQNMAQFFTRPEAVAVVATSRPLSIQNVQTTQTQQQLDIPQGVASDEQRKYFILMPMPVNVGQTRLKYPFPIKTPGSLEGDLLFDTFP